MSWRPSSLFVQAAAVCAPGLADWNATRSVLQGTKPYRADGLPPLTVPGLPPNEQRRITLSTRLALCVAARALQQACPDAAVRIHAIFACSGGNAEALDAIIAALAAPGCALSPRQFSHVDHNAAAGYWGILRGAAGVSVSLGAFDGSFAAGLLETAGASLDVPRVLLVAYDVPPPPMLQPHRSICAPFAAALLFSRTPADDSLGCWQWQLGGAHAEDQCADPNLEALRQGNPAARCLPLLQGLATGTCGTVALPYLPDRCLIVEYRPC